MDVYNDIYNTMRTRQSPEKPSLVLSDNKNEIALFTPSLNQIAMGQKFIDLARSFGKDSMNVIAQVMSYELAHVLLEQSSIIKDIGSGYASKEFNKRIKKTMSLCVILYLKDRQMSVLFSMLKLRVIKPLVLRHAFLTLSTSNGILKTVI